MSETVGNGIWVVNANGSDAHQFLGATDPDAGAPSVVAMSPSGDRLLAFYPKLAGEFVGRGPLYAVVDATTGAANPLVVLDPDHPPFASVSSAAFSPDGQALLTTTIRTDPDLQVFVRAVDGDTEQALTPDGLPSLGPVAFGLLPTWATNGTVLLTGAGSLSHATLLLLGGDPVAPSD